jgi:DnaJ like chaperone protein
VLGLEHGASIEEVKRAYRRLAQVHHPDKFAALGKEAVAAATSTFQRIQDAYQYLVNHA